MKHLFSLALFLFSFSVMGQKFHTEFKYTDSINKGISIQNSYPKGGQKYTDANGKEYVYVIFWTRITNDTDADLKVAINFPIDSFIVPASPHINFTFYLPKEEMNIEKENLFNYGLNIESFLDENIEKPSQLEKTIGPNEAYLFYNVALSNQGVNGVVRARFELHKQALRYKINDIEFNCGLIKTEK